MTVDELQRADVITGPHWAMIDTKGDIVARSGGYNSFVYNVPAYFKKFKVYQITVEGPGDGWGRCPVVIIYIGRG